MHTALQRLRARFRRLPAPDAVARAHADDCSWDVMRATYEEQAARGVPEAVHGLESIEQGRWPSSGRRRDGARVADG